MLTQLTLLTANDPELGEIIRKTVKTKARHSANSFANSANFANFAIAKFESCFKQIVLPLAKFALCFKILICFLRNLCCVLC